MSKTFYNINFKKYSRWKIGGVVRELFIPNTKSDFVQKIRNLLTSKKNYNVVGQTSNLLVNDGNIDCTLIKVGSEYADIYNNESEIICDSGLDVPTLNWKLSQHGYSGIEHTCGIPGTIGGLVCMNGGSNRKSISENIKWVEVIYEDGSLGKIEKTKCNFSYRNSIFQSGKYTILRVCLTNFTKCKKSEIRQKCLRILKERKAKFPQKLPNCGSFFKRNIDVINTIGAPGKIIENLGFKGFKVGDAQVSYQHANFINNIGNASANDVISISKIINEKIFNRHGFKLISESRYLSENGKISEITNLVNE